MIPQDTSRDEITDAEIARHRLGTLAQRAEAAEVAIRRVLQVLDADAMEDIRAEEWITESSVTETERRLAALYAAWATYTDHLKQGKKA